MCLNCNTFPQLLAAWKWEFKSLRNCWKRKGPKVPRKEQRQKLAWRRHWNGCEQKQLKSWSAMMRLLHASRSSKTNSFLLYRSHFVSQSSGTGYAWLHYMCSECSDLSVSLGINETLCKRTCPRYCAFRFLRIAIFLPWSMTFHSASFKRTTY